MLSYVSPEPPYLPSKFIRTRQETGPGPVPHVRDSIQPSISDSRGASCTHRPLRANRNVYLHEYDSSPRPGAERMSPANRFPLLGHLWFFEECYVSLVGRVNRYARGSGTDRRIPPPQTRQRSQTGGRRQPEFRSAVARIEPLTCLCTCARCLLHDTKSLSGSLPHPPGNRYPS